MCQYLSVFFVINCFQNGSERVDKQNYNISHKYMWIECIVAEFIGHRSVLCTLIRLLHLPKCTRFKPVDPSWLFSHSCSVLVVYPWLTCSGCSVLRLSYRCSVLFLLPWLTCSSSSVLWSARSCPSPRQSCPSLRPSNICPPLPAEWTSS